MEYPFVYISAMPRTGSTMLSEALSYFPFAYIFREPHLGKNYFAFQEHDTKVFSKIGINMYENILHQKRITTNSVYKWRIEKNHHLLREAYDFSKRIPEYITHWGYDI